MVSTDQLHQLLLQLPNDLPVSRGLVTNLIEDLDAGPTTVEDVLATLIATFVALEQRISAIEAAR